MGRVISISDLPLPVVHFGAGIRLVKTPNELRLMSETAIMAKSGFPVQNQWYATLDDHWFQATNIEKVKRAPLWKRFVGVDDLMVAEFSLAEVKGMGEDWQWYFDILFGLAGDKLNLKGIALKGAQKELERLEGPAALVNWYLKYF